MTPSLLRRFYTPNHPKDMNDKCEDYGNVPQITVLDGQFWTVSRLQPDTETLQKGKSVFRNGGTPQRHPSCFIKCTKKRML